MPALDMLAHSRQRITHCLRQHSVEGNDVAGTISAVGPDVTEFKPGDRVAAFTKMMSDAKYGAYQEYSIALATCTFPLGPNTSFEDASTLPLAVGTAFLGLYKRLALTPLPDFSGKVKQHGTPIVVYGASSSVGSFVVQLAKLSGYYVLGIAGSGASYAKEVGADDIVDYRGKDVQQLAKDVKAALEGHGTLQYICNNSLTLIRKPTLISGSRRCC